MFESSHFHHKSMMKNSAKWNNDILPAFSTLNAAGCTQEWACTAGNFITAKQPSSRIGDERACWYWQCLMLHVYKTMPVSTGFISTSSCRRLLQNCFLPGGHASSWAQRAALQVLKVGKSWSDGCNTLFCDISKLFGQLYEAESIALDGSFNDFSEFSRI